MKHKLLILLGCLLLWWLGKLKGFASQELSKLLMRKLKSRR